MQYTKPALSIEDQINLLKSRGLIVPNQNRAEHYLSHISYYRLSAYYRPLQISQDKFRPNAKFDDVLKLYLFDKELKNLLMDAIERIEVAFRTIYVNKASLHYSDTHWYENRTNFNNVTKHTEGLRKLDKSIIHSSEAFIKHYLNNYSNPARPPAYMAFEVMSFGWLSYFYKNLKNNNLKNKIAHHFGLNNYKEFESWINSIGELRNSCAHHSRVWNSVSTFKPRVLRRTNKPWIHDKSTINTFKVYSVMSSIAYLLKTINPKSHFSYKLQKLLIRYPEIDETAMGFPKDWRKEKVWQFPKPFLYRVCYLNVCRIKQKGTVNYN